MLCTQRRLTARAAHASRSKAYSNLPIFYRLLNSRENYGGQKVANKTNRQGFPELRRILRTESTALSTGPVDKYISSAKTSGCRDTVRDDFNNRPQPTSSPPATPARPTGLRGWWPAVNFAELLVSSRVRIGRSLLTRTEQACPSGCELVGTDQYPVLALADAIRINSRDAPMKTMLCMIPEHCATV